MFAFARECDSPRQRELLLASSYWTKLELVSRHSRSRGVCYARAFDTRAPLGGGGETANETRVRCAEGGGSNVEHSRFFIISWLSEARDCGVCVGRRKRKRKKRKRTRTELAAVRTLRFARTRGVRDRLGAWARRRAGEANALRWRGPGGGPVCFQARPFPRKRLQPFPPKNPSPLAEPVPRIGPVVEGRRGLETRESV